jgi:hypothetical protein
VSRIKSKKREKMKSGSRFFISFISLISVFALTILAITATAEGIKGDVNGDGEITSVDALLALKMSVGKIQPNAIADVNDDGRITSFDAFKILQMAVGIEKSSMDEIAKILNSKGFASFFGNERMNWEVKRKDGSIVNYAVIIENGEITYLSEGKLDNPTLEGYVSEETIDKIRDSDDWLKAAKEALDNGEIRIEGVGLVNQLKVGILNLASKLGIGFG